ncbi:unnamed protein product [Victoria cruziana]
MSVSRRHTLQHLPALKLLVGFPCPFLHCQTTNSPEHGPAPSAMHVVSASLHTDGVPLTRRSQQRTLGFSSGVDYCLVWRMKGALLNLCYVRTYTLSH